MSDLRLVELTNNRLVIDGQDISHLVVAARVDVRHDSFPILRLECVPDEVLFTGMAVVDGVPLDGIARLRARGF